jgi:hypothetical protein
LRYQAPAVHQLAEKPLGGFRGVSGIAGTAPCDFARLPITRGKTLAVLPDPFGDRIAVRHAVVATDAVQRPADAQFTEDAQA